MWVTKLLIFPVEIRIFCPKTTKFGPKLTFLVNLGQAMQAYSMPCCGSVGGCGARAVSRKTPIYFILVFSNAFSNFQGVCEDGCEETCVVRGCDKLSQLADSHKLGRTSCGQLARSEEGKYKYNNKIQ